VSSIAAVNELMQLPASIPNKNVVIVAPSYSQTIDVYWNLLMFQLGIAEHCTKASKDTGRILFPNAVELKLISYEAVERLRGGGIYYLVCDETRDWTSGGGFQDAWDSILQPCMATRWSPMQAEKYGAVSAARSLVISTPRGYDHLYTLSRMQETDKSYKTYVYNYSKSPLLDQSEVERLRATLDPISFSREFDANFKDSGATVFYCFDRDVHVKNDLEDFEIGTLENKGTDVHIGVDFNVMRQCSSAFAIRNKQVHYLEEFQGSADTESLAISIKAKFWPNFNKIGHPEYNKKVCKIYIYPDASGKARKTSAPIGVTDHSILTTHGFIVLSHNANPPIVDSVNCVNRLLKTASGAVSLYVHPRCKGLIVSLERTSWLDKNPDTATIDKSKNEEHFSDSVRYPMEYLFPINVGKKTTSRGFGF
jgi:hypothetical protein